MPAPPPRAPGPTSGHLQSAPCGERRGGGAAASCASFFARTCMTTARFQAVPNQQIPGYCLISLKCLNYC